MLSPNLTSKSELHQILFLSSRISFVDWAGHQQNAFYDCQEKEVWQTADNLWWIRSLWIWQQVSVDFSSDPCALKTISPVFSRLQLSFYMFFAIAPRARMVCAMHPKFQRHWTKTLHPPLSLNFDAPSFFWHLVSLARPAYLAATWCWR